MSRKERLAMLQLQRLETAQYEERQKAIYLAFRDARIQLDREIAEAEGHTSLVPISAHAACDVPSDDPTFEAFMASTI